MSDRLLPIKPDVLDALHVSYPTAKAMIKDGRLPVVRLGRMVRVKASALTDIVEHGVVEKARA